MPINIPNNLPAYSTLLQENIFVMSHDRASHQDIRPLKIAILNLMPTKIETETQLLRLLSNTPLQVDISLLHPATHTPKNTPAEHLNNFYKNFNEIKHQYFDGLIITGAPVELLNFTEVNYWDELKTIMEWSKSHVYSTVHICWGAYAGLYYHYSIDKYELDEKMFGIFPHKLNVTNHPLLKGFDDIFMVPHSRYTGVKTEDIINCRELQLLTYSDIAGVHIVADKTDRQFFITGHSEYDLMSLATEYYRDINKGINIKIPYNYFPSDDPSKTPVYTWRCTASLMFFNWLNFCVYQKTPFNLDEISL